MPVIPIRLYSFRIRKAGVTQWVLCLVPTDLPVPSFQPFPPGLNQVAGIHGHVSLRDPQESGFPTDGPTSCGMLRKKRTGSV